MCKYYDLLCVSLRSAVYPLALRQVPGFMWEDMFTGKIVRKLQQVPHVCPCCGAVQLLVCKWSCMGQALIVHGA